MTKVQSIIKEIQQLSQEEVELIYLELKKQMERSDKVKAALDKYSGSGTGFWEEDAQEYITKLREENSDE